MNSHIQAWSESEASESDSDDSGFEDSSLWRDPSMLKMLAKMPRPSSKEEASMEEEASTEEEADEDEYGHEYDNNAWSGDERISRFTASQMAPSTVGNERPVTMVRISNETSEAERDSGAEDAGLTKSEATSHTRESSGPSNADEEENVEGEDEDAYSIWWRHGLLGLAFRGNGRGETAIRRVNQREGMAEGLENARVGDVLAAINGHSVVGRSADDLMEELQAPTLPMRLDFAPVRWEDCDQDSYRPSTDEYPDTSLDLRSLSLMEQEQELESEPVVEVDDEYDVLWTQGALRCALKPIDGVPMVKKVSSKPAADPSISLIAPGDVMLEINGLNCAGIGFRAVIAILQTGNKPVQMRFRRKGTENDLTEQFVEQQSPAAPYYPPVLGPNQYTVEWNDESLGIQLKGGTDGTVIISKHTGGGHPHFRDQIAVGDILVQVGETLIHDIGVDATFDLLRRVKKPVTLLLERVMFQRVEYNPSETQGSHVPNLRMLRLNERLNREQHVVTPAARYNVSQERRRTPERPMPLPSRESEAVEWIEPTPSRPRPYSAHPSVGAVAPYTDIERARVMSLPVASVPLPPAYGHVYATMGDVRRRMNHRPQPRVDPRPNVVASRPPQLPAPPSYNDVVGYCPPSNNRIDEVERLRRAHMQMERRKVEMSPYSQSPLSQQLWLRWCEGPLGITFRRKGDRIVVSRLTGAGRSRRLEQLFPGDWLVKFGNETVGLYKTKDMRVSEAVGVLRHLPKPVDLWFLTS